MIYKKSILLIFCGLFSFASIFSQEIADTSNYNIPYDSLNIEVFDSTQLNYGDTLPMIPDEIEKIAEPSQIFWYDTISSDLVLMKDSPLLAMLDSLMVIKFFTNDTLKTDSVDLNIYGYKPNEIPKFSDSIYRARIEDLNLQTPIELTYNNVVKTYIGLYADRRRKLVSKMLGLAQVYFPLFEESLDKYNMPIELKYLAIVESALNPTAGSHAGAKGLWQFMYGTGKMYGLNSNSIIDDRFDPIKATDAACKHLSDLYDIYGNWSLAMAAYNSGPGNVNKALRRSGGIKSYWAVWPHLPRETRGYVPAFIAVTYIMNYAPEHNLYPIDPGLLYSGTDTVMIHDALSFDQISEMLDISYENLKFLNPAYKLGIIPATKTKEYALRLPHKYIGLFINNEDSLYNFKTKKGVERDHLLAEIRKAQDRSIHRVRSGESLGLIARKYRVSVGKIKRWNGLRSNTIFPGQKLIVYPMPGYTASKGKISSTSNSSYSSVKKQIHTVRNGENLGLIANKYDCSVSEIKLWNGLRSNTIRIGQKLKVKSPYKTKTIDLKNRKLVNYTVKNGDNLWIIAKKYSGVSVDDIKSANSLKSSRLKIGQKLKIPLRS